MTLGKIRAHAFQVESAALGAVAAGLTGADLERPSGCPPWTVAGLLGHIIVAAGRVQQAVEAAVDGGAGQPGGTSRDLIGPRGYYRADHRFSPVVNSDRIDVAATLAARLRTPAALTAGLRAACEQTLGLLAASPPDTEVRTRHGDRMLLTDFAVTRVVKLGVHGLDLALALDRPSWLTDPAAAVLEDLLLPDVSQAARLRGVLRCDRAGVIARLTGRVPLSAAEQSALAASGVICLTLG